MDLRELDGGDALDGSVSYSSYASSPWLALNNNSGGGGEVSGPLPPPPPPQQQQQQSHTNNNSPPHGIAQAAVARPAEEYYQADTARVSTKIADLINPPAATTMPGPNSADYNFYPQPSYVGQQMYQQQYPRHQHQQKQPDYYLYDEPSYLSKLWENRRTVVKLILLSLVVLLAVSLHSTATTYLARAAEAVLRGIPVTSYKWWLYDTALRMAYPLVVLLLLWNIKVFWT